MAYVNLWVAFLAVIQCSAISCYDVYTWKYEEDDHELTSLEKMDQFLAENRGIGILIGAVINTALLAILFCCIKLCCPTCCRKTRQGIVFNITDIQVPEVQPLGYLSGRRFDAENKY